MQRTPSHQVLECAERTSMTLSDGQRRFVIYKTYLITLYFNSYKYVQHKLLDYMFLKNLKLITGEIKHLLVSYRLFQRYLIKKILACEEVHFLCDQSFESAPLKLVDFMMFMIRKKRIVNVNKV